MRKKVDSRVRTLVQNGVLLGHRSMFVLVGDNAREQVVNLHYMLSKAAVRARPSVLWCYKKELGFTTHRKKRMRNIKKMIARGLLDPDKDDPFELFISSTSIQYCYYRETTRILGNTFGMLVLQDFEAVTPNVLARTIETVEGGGLVVFLLKSMDSLRQLYTMSMDAHARFRTEAHAEVQPRFNERFILSLASCANCLVLDDELNVLPISSHCRDIVPVTLSKSQKKKLVGKRSAAADDDADASDGDDDDDDDGDGDGGDGDGGDIGATAGGVRAESKELRALKSSLQETQPIGSIVQLVRTLDQAKALLTFVEAAAEKSLRATVALTAARGRGKSAALGLSLAAAIAYGYANIFVTAPSPENLRTLFEFVLKGFDALEYKEHTDFTLVASTNPELRGAIVRVNVYRAHRQTIQYVLPEDSALLAQAELLVIDEAAAIPLPQVRALLGPYLVFMASTVNGYEGTGRALSLKLIQQLRSSSSASASGPANTSAGADELADAGRTLREVSLDEPIRYAHGDPIEAWLLQLLCLDAERKLPAVRGCPHPSECDLYWVDRDALFSYHSASEAFLQRMLALCVASHYKNTPNDLLLMSDAPAHQLFVLLGPVDVEAKALPDVLAVVQLSLEGEISRESVAKAMGRGEMPSGDMIPWTMSTQFQESDFAALSGARVVRIATHPDLQHMGYGSRAVQLLISYYQGEVAPLPSAKLPADKNRATKKANGASAGGGDGLLAEQIVPRSGLPPLLLTLAQRPAEPLHWLGASFGLTEQLYNFWHKNGFRPVYVRQTKNEVTGEHSAVVLRALDESRRELPTSTAADWLPQYVADFRRRLAALLALSLREMPCSLALSLLDPELQPAESVSPPLEQLEYMLGPYDLKRLSSYARSLVDHHLVIDLVPQLAQLRFTGRLLTPLSSVQAAILLGVGLQAKSFDAIEKELGLPVSQLLALFNKVIRKVVTVLQSERERVAAIDLPGPRAADEATAHMRPIEGGLQGELEQGALESLEQMKEENAAKGQQWLTASELSRFEIKGSEEDWQAALGNAKKGSAAPPGRINMKSTTPREGKGKRNGHDSATKSHKKRK